MYELMHVVLLKPSEGFKLLKQIAAFLNYPVQGDFAFALWQLCSGNHGLRPSDASDLYRQLGYLPFKGYPLVRDPNFQKPVISQSLAELMA